MKNNLKQITVLRNKIDIIDDQLLDLIAQRQQIVERIGRLKHIDKIQTIDKQRWQKVLEKVTLKAKTLKISPTFIKKIYKLIHDNSLKLQNVKKNN